MNDIKTALMEDAAREYLAGLPPDRRAEFIADCTGTNRKPSRLLTMRDVAERFGCTVRTVQRWCRTGELQTIRRGRLVRIPEDALYSMQTTGARNE